MALVFALLMIGSMPAMAVAGSGLGGAPTQSDAGVTDVGVTQSVDDRTNAPAEIDDDLRDADGEVDVVVRFDETDVAGAATTDDAIGQLQTHAQATQVSFLEWVKETESVTFQNDFWIANAILVTVDTERAEQDGIDPFDEMAAQPDVERLHANFELSTMDGTTADANESETTVETPESTAYDTTYGLEMINATEVWDNHGTQGDGAAVAILDTGLDDDHPDMEIDEGNWAEFDGSGEPVDSDPNDGHGHGTHVSGTVLGPAEPADEDVPAYGVAPNAELYNAKVLDDMGGGTFAQIIAGMEWAVDDTDADVVSMSLGAPGYESDMIEPSENARDAGVLLVSSIGNDGEGTSGSPGNVYPNVASGAVDENTDVASFSGGEEVTTDTAYPDAPDYWPDEYVVPDVAAPGVDVLSAHPAGGTMCAGGPEYCEVSGTSMSAPHKAGAFALMIAASGGAADREALIDAMEETAWKPDDWDEPDEKDVRYGYGIIDVAAATDLVALDSGINGTVTDADGDPIEGATVTIDETDTSVTTDADGQYTLLAQPDEYTVTADAFGYAEASESVEVPDDETFVEQDFELADGVGAALIAGQPDGLEGGDSFDVTFDVANLETYTVDRAGDYDGDLTLAFDGESIDEGEEVDVGDVTGEVTLSVTTEVDTAGDLELEHTFAGSGDTETITTGPTAVFEEFVPVAVVDDGTWGDDVVDRLEAQLDASYDLSLLSGSEAVDAAENDEYEAYVVQDIDETHVADFATQTDSPSTGVVWLDNWGSSSNAIPAKSNVLENPESTSQSFTSPNPDVEILADHPIFEGIGDVGDTVSIHSATFADHSWFDGYDGEIVGYIQAGGVDDGDGIGVDEEKRTALLSSFGSSSFVDSGDFSTEADVALANALAWSAIQPAADLVAEQPVHAEPGERFGATFNMDDVESVQVSLADESTVDQDDLDLYLDDEANDWDEWRTYEPPTSEDAYAVEVDPSADAVGSVVLETTVVSADGDEVTITTGPTAVFEAPLTVPEDVETIQEAIDLAPDGTEIVVQAGTYEESVSIADTEGLTITGEDGATVVSDDTAVTIAANETTLAGLGAEGVAVEDTRNVTVSDVDATNADTGVSVTDSTNVDVTGVETADVDTGINVADAESVDVSANAVSATGDGIAVSDAADVAIADNTVSDAATAVAVSGGTVDASANDLAETGTGIAVADGATATVTDNEVTDSGVGLAIDGAWTTVDATMNAIAADTGVHASDISSDAITVEFNDLEASETALAQEGGNALDARLNWFGDRGPESGVSGDVVYQPFLTDEPDEVDRNETIEIAIDFDLEAGEMYTIGVPGTTQQSINDAFGDLDGSVYGYDSDDNEWVTLRKNDEMSSLTAMVIVPDEDSHAVLDFQSGGDHVVPGSQQLHQGWNLVSATAYTEYDDAFGATNAPDSVLEAYEHPEGHLGEDVAHLGGEYDIGGDVNPFGGYWVHVESADDEYEYGVELHVDPTPADLYEGLGLMDDDDDENDEPELPDEIDVAVVDETDYFDGEIESVLDERLDSTYAVDTLEADDLLDAMDDYDVFVVQRIGSDSLAEDFYDALGPDQATVHMDSYQGGTAEAYADGVYRLHTVNDDPAERDADATATDGEPVTIDIHQDHPIFDGIGSAGDTVEVYTGTTTWGAWFDDYSGQILADGDWSAGTPGEHEGGAVAVNEAENQVLNTASARDFFTNEADFTDEGNQLLANSVEHAATLAFNVAATEESEITASAAAPAGAIVG
ncbi:S8 family serine peptidase [Halovivax gelatinilyticus]|uniref:S8 family serine peptidase n=1 Tax=Halovivax gelatinilyticus TaxID=2961597 RepID=UPI0020CA3C25|nr:S8 family serine peptidase [Halovivax gelatinilyticus]